MRYIPLTDFDRRAMLDAIGVREFSDLVANIPKQARANGLKGIGEPVAEHTLLSTLAERAAVKPDDLLSFAGAGCYEHFVPSAVMPLVQRGEFLTAYTPYQPEISQGTLQAAFEFQTFVALLTGMEVANASMYDGATAAAEALLMAARVTGRKCAVVSSALHPEYRDVLRTYAEPAGIELIDAAFDATSGATSLAQLTEGIERAGAQLAGVFVQSPNFFGVVEDWRAVRETLKAAAPHTEGALLIGVVAEATSLGVLTPPGAFDADIVCGEGQAWGLPMQWGGPHVGFFASRQTYLRQLPGRLVGETVDSDGRRAFVLTLTAREQHIRREKATSNICTSQQLCALWVTIWLSLMGKRGVYELARRNMSAAAALQAKLARLPGYSLRFRGPTYNEFVLECPRPAAEIVRRLAAKHIVPGVALDRFFGTAFERALLVCVTELRSSADLERLFMALTEVA